MSRLFDLTIRCFAIPFLLVMLGASSIPTTQDAKLADAELSIQKIYAAEFASKKPRDREQLAELLLQRGRNETTDPVRRQVLFRDSRDVAQEIGDVITACAAAIELANDTHGNPIEFRIATLASLAAHVTTAEKIRSFIDECLKLAKDAIDVGDYSPASKALSLADKPAQTLKDPLRITYLRECADDLSTRTHNADALRQARDTLKIRPDDAAANTLVGRELCLIRLDWKSGLPNLAKANDPNIQLAAGTELNAKSPADFLRAADAWWDVSQKEVGPTRAITSSRAQRLYQNSFAHCEGSDRIRALSRILQSLNTSLSAGQIFRDDPQALQAAAGPRQAELARCLTIQKFALRTDKPDLKRIYVQFEITAPRILVTADHVDVKIRFLCRDASGASHVTEIHRPIKTQSAGTTSFHFTGPDVQSIKPLNDNIWCPRNAYAAVTIDDIPIWQSLWKTPEQSAWWLDDSLIVKKP